MAKYIYKLAIGAASGELFVPDSDAVYQWKEEGQYDGFMRKNIKDLIITKDYDDGSGTRPNATIFDTLWEYYFDSTKQTTEIVITIYKDAVLDYEGYFYIKDGDIDVNNGIYVIKATTDDDYSEFLQLLDNDVDIIDASGAYNATLTHTTETQSEIGTIIDPPDFAPSGSWVRGTGATNTRWYREKSLYNDINNEFDASGIPYQGYYYFPILTFPISDIPPYGAGMTLNFSFPNCFLLTERIQYFLDQLLGSISLSLTFVSKLFTDSPNYVTGESTNMLPYTLINQKTDTKDPDATNKATKGVITFNQLMSDLKAMFDVRWYIDGTDLIIEHESWFYNGLAKSFIKTAEINLTDDAKYTDAGSQKLFIEDTQNYISAKVEDVKSETIKFIDEDGIDFRSVFFKIEYDTLADKAMNKKHTVAFISTDVGKAINNPDDIENDGFYLFNCEESIGGVSSIIEREEDYTNTLTDNIANAAFSVKWLLHDYYEYGRPDSSGTLSLPSGSTTSTPYAVQSTVPIYLQKDIVFLLNNADSIDINKYIATYLIKSDEVKYVVNGSIIEIEHDLETDFVTATLGYEL